MKKLLASSICVFLVIISLPSANAEGTSICTKIQNQKDYFKVSETRNWTSLTETRKYEKYIELVLANSRCVSSQDSRFAREYVQSILENCPPKPGTLLDLYGKGTLTQLCSWARQVKKRL